jgi:hypothetical protein
MPDLTMLKLIQDTMLGAKYIPKFYVHPCAIGNIRAGIRHVQWGKANSEIRRMRTVFAGLLLGL